MGVYREGTGVGGGGWGVGVEESSERNTRKKTVGEVGGPKQKGMKQTTSE